MRIHQIGNSFMIGAGIVGFMNLPFIPASFADVADDAKSKLIEAIHAKPKCDAVAIKSMTKEVKIDDVLILEAAKFGCLIPVVQPHMPGKDASAEDIKAWRELLGKAEKSYFDYVEEFLPKARKAMAVGQAPWTLEESYALGNSTAVFQSASKDICTNPKNVDSQSLDLCKQRARVDSDTNELLKIGEDVDRVNAHRKKPKISGPARCTGELQSDPECAAYYHKIMVQKVTNAKAEWEGYDPYEYKLIQLTGGYAVFAALGSESLIAFDQKSLNFKDHMPLVQGENIVNAIGGTSGGAMCAGFQSEGTVKNAAGFDVHIFRYKAVKCPPLN